MTKDSTSIALTGNLGKDPHITITKTKKEKMARFSLAVDSGEDNEITEWFTVLCFDPKIADVIEEHLAKGSRVRIQGRKQVSYAVIDGECREFKEIIMDGPLALL